MISEEVTRIRPCEKMTWMGRPVGWSNLSEVKDVVDSLLNIVECLRDDMRRTSELERLVRNAPPRPSF